MLGGDEEDRLVRIERIETWRPGRLLVKDTMTPDVGGERWSSRVTEAERIGCLG